MRARSGFRERVYEIVRQIPRGRVTTYGAVATLVYSPRAARAVGQALKAGLWGPDEVPWQRVINAAGRISFKGDLARARLQRALLEAEGIEFEESDEVGLADSSDLAARIDLNRYGWWG